MADPISVPHPRSPAPGIYGINRDSFNSYLRGVAFDGTTNPYGAHAYLTYGDITASQGGREVYGPVLLGYLTRQVLQHLEGPDILEAHKIETQAQLARLALQDILESRRTPEGRADYRSRLARLTAQAAVRREAEPLIDAAMVAKEVFDREETGTLAQDVVAALGSFTLSSIQSDTRRPPYDDATRSNESQTGTPA